MGTGKTLTPAGLVSRRQQRANYAYSYATLTTGVINQTNLTVTAAANTKLYDGTTSAAATPTVTAGSIQTGDTAAFTETYDTRDVGTGKTLTAAGVVSDGNGGANYAYIYQTATTGVINQTNLTVTAAANTKTYDGTTSATATPTIGPGSIQTGDTAPAWTETYDNKNAGTGKTLTPASLVVSDGNGGANYAYTYATLTTGVITKTNLTVTAADNTKTYDGTTTATATPTVTAGGIQTGDTAPAWMETYDTRNAGTGKTLTPAGLVNDGNSGANYAYTYATVTTGVINQTNLTVTAAANSKLYDGTTSATAAPTLTGNIQTGDTAPAWTESYDNANVGTGKTLTPAGLVNDGNSGTNYNYSFVATQNGIITIATTANTLVSSPNPSLPGSNVTFTATVTNAVADGPTPTGNVQFKTNGVPLCAAVALDGSGVATLITNSLPHGSNTVTAEYAGDGNFLGSTNSVAQVVNTPPEANLATYMRNSGLSYKIRISDLITNYTSDADGDARTLAAVGSSTNSATITTNSTWIFYVPPPASNVNSNATDYFSYTISDGFAGGTVSGMIRMAVINPTNGPPSGNLIVATVVTNGVAITFVGIPNYVYHVQRTTLLAGTNTAWWDLGTCTVNAAGNGAFTDTSPPSGQAYYRTSWP